MYSYRELENYLLIRGIYQIKCVINENSIITPKAEGNDKDDILCIRIKLFLERNSRERREAKNIRES